MKFLHISDVHLGCTRYQLEESPKDFFDSWFDVIKKYAIAEKVDFVVMGGDFFHKQNVPPETIGYAFAGLNLLRNAGIPVISIEGNHDKRQNDSDYSWLRTLANWNLLYLLEPTNHEGKITYQSWSEEDGKGGFVDIGNARIFGSHWYGASANSSIPLLTEAIEENQRENAFHILLLHTDVENHQKRPIPTLTIANLNKLKAVTNYVALGHTHLSYEIDNWAFNPGSLEITSIDDYEQRRGAFLVEVNEQMEVSATHVSDYKRRSFQRLSFDVSGIAEVEDVKKGILEMVNNEAKTVENNEKPIIEIILRGHLGTTSISEIIKEVREESRKLTGALDVIIKNNSVPIDYGYPSEMTNVSREEIERNVIEKFVIDKLTYRKFSQEMVNTVIEVKKMALEDKEPEHIIDLISMTLKLGEQQNVD